MSRVVNRHPSFRQNAREWIYKMLFLYSREQAPNSKAGSWLAWFATAVLLWRCRRRIARAILAISPFRLLKRRSANLAISQKIPTTVILKQQKRNRLALHKHHVARLRRMKRMCAGDGPHVSGAISMIQPGSQIHYRVTRSGRIYGKYANEVIIPSCGIQGSH